MIQNKLTLEILLCIAFIFETIGAIIALHYMKEFTNTVNKIINKEKLNKEDILYFIPDLIVVTNAMTGLLIASELGCFM